jgi:two-component system OmpR family sensor kinase
MRRLPIRLKLTLAFALVMAAVLAATGLFLYLRLRSDLDATVDQGLRSRAGDVIALVKQADTGLAQSGSSPLAARSGGFAQIVDDRGKVVDATPQIGKRSLLSPPELQRALRHTTLVQRGPLPGLDQSSRLLATATAAQDKRLVVIVGASLEQRNEALGNLGSTLLVGGPIALLLASLAGYGLAAAALRPVESMRRRAAAISSEEPGQRLPVPPARDELSRLGDTLNAMLERLEAAFAREQTFVSDASHELRTPLTILKAELELALRGERSPTDYRQALASATVEADRLVRLAEDLLVIARSGEGGLPVRLSEVSVDTVLQHTRERFAQRGADLGRAIEVTDAPALKLEADPLRLEQALGNMIDNALRHGSGSVVLSARERDGGVAVHVVDAGPGIPEGFAATAFERFTRADSARGRGGAGLGLAIVAAIASAHGGTVGAENVPGGGADVWIWLPLDPGRVADPVS